MSFELKVSNWETKPSGWGREVKRVPGGFVFGPSGNMIVTRGYFEIHGLRIYDDVPLFPHRRRPPLGGGET